MKQFVSLLGFFFFIQTHICHAIPDVDGISWRLVGKTIRNDYENGQSYIVTFSEQSLTWTGVKGTETGRSETDSYDFQRISPSTYLVNWVESDRSFVASVINFKKMTVYTTGYSNGQKWQTTGKITLISD